jgi:hypothetical protein
LRVIGFLIDLTSDSFKRTTRRHTRCANESADRRYILVAL